jgi:hypothetical protein
MLSQVNNYLRQIRFNANLSKTVWYGRLQCKQTWPGSVGNLHPLHQDGMTVESRSSSIPICVQIRLLTTYVYVAARIIDSSFSTYLLWRNMLYRILVALLYQSKQSRPQLRCGTRLDLQGVSWPIKEKVLPRALSTNPDFWTQIFSVKETKTAIELPGLTMKVEIRFVSQW